MTRFAAKLDRLMDTVQLACRADFASLSDALRAGRGRPAVAIGSGGSAISAHFFARCRETLFEQPTEVVTAAEFVLGTRDLADSDIWLFSAGADNEDSMACLVTARSRGDGLSIVTRSPDGATALAATGDPRNRLFVVPVAESKDGFLATHSLVATIVALLYASDAASDDPVGDALEPFVRDSMATYLGKDFRSAIHANFASITREDLLLLIVDPQLRPVAELIETSLWEASLCAVQRTDVRNFAHGRHSWIHHRPERSFLLGLATNESLPLWHRIADRLTQIRTEVSVAADGGRYSNAMGVVQALVLVEAIGAAVGIDPAKPGIGDFGRALYEDAALLDVARSLGPAIRQKRAALLARDDIGVAGHCVRSREEERRRELADAKIGGLILDYDGTIITDAERYGVPRAEIASELVRLDASGVKIGIATGRGGSGGKALRDVLPADLHPRIIIGYYNGAYAVPLNVDIEREPPPADPCLEETFAWFNAHPDLFCGSFGGRFSNVQISIKLENLADMTSFPVALADCPPIESGAVRFAFSGHSIDFFASATSKTRVRDMLRSSLGEEMSIVCAGDSGARSGNDHEMLTHPVGISVGTVCGRPEGCWSLYGKRVTGPEALLRLLTAMKPDVQGIVRIDVQSLRLDSFVEMSTNREHDVH